MWIGTYDINWTSGFKFLLAREALTNWSWPGKKSRWTLIGHERWDDLNGFCWKTEAQYALPNPSTTPRGHDPTPLGHWAVTYDWKGEETDRQWSADILTEGALYLKGGGSKGKGKGQNLSVCNHMIGV